MEPKDRLSEECVKDLAQLVFDLRKRGAWAVANSLPSTAERGLPPEILEAAEELCAGPDSEDVERSALEAILRLALSAALLMVSFNPND